MRSHTWSLSVAACLCALAVLGARAAEQEKSDADKGHVAKSKEDQEVVAKQGPKYPLTTCVVTGETLVEGGTVDLICKGRLVRLCCAGCIGKFQAKAEKYLAELDKAAKEDAPAKPKDGAGAVKCPAAGKGCGGCGGCR